MSYPNEWNKVPYEQIEDLIEYDSKENALREAWLRGRDSNK